MIKGSGQVPRSDRAVRCCGWSEEAVECVASGDQWERTGVEVKERLEAAGDQWERSAEWEGVVKCCWRSVEAAQCVETIE